VLKKVNFDKKMEKVGVEKFVARTGLSSSALLGRIVKLVLTWIVWTTAFATFGPSNPVSKFLTSVINYVPKAIVAVVILGVTAALAGFVGDVMKRGVAAAKFPPLTARVAPVAVWVIGGFAAVDQLGVAASTTHTLFQALMAVIVGSAIVAVGGGGIAPMRKQWENVIAKQAKANASTPLVSEDGWPVKQG
jgi:Conserved TM helix